MKRKEQEVSQESEEEQRRRAALKVLSVAFKLSPYFNTLKDADLLPLVKHTRGFDLLIITDIPIEEPKRQHAFALSKIGVPFDVSIPIIDPKRTFIERVKNLVKAPTTQGVEFKTFDIAPSGITKEWLEKVTKELEELYSIVREPQKNKPA